MDRAISYYSDHALRRLKDWEVPLYVERKLVRDAFQAQGTYKDQDLVIYRIVKVKGGKFYVAVEVDGVLVTVTPVEPTQAYNWFKNRLYNFEYMWKQIHRLPIYRDPEAPSGPSWTPYDDEVTKELAAEFGVHIDE